LVIQVLNSKLGITLRVSVTSATILTSGREEGCRCDRNT